MLLSPPPPPARRRRDRPLPPTPIRLPPRLATPFTSIAIAALESWRCGSQGVTDASACDLATALTALLYFMKWPESPRIAVNAPPSHQKMARITSVAVNAPPSHQQMARITSDCCLGRLSLCVCNPRTTSLGQCESGSKTRTCPGWLCRAVSVRPPPGPKR